VTFGCLAFTSQAAGQAIQLTPFGQGAFTQPVSVASPPGDPTRVFVVEIAGTVRLMKDGVRQAQPFLTIPGDVYDSTDSVADGNGDGNCFECGMFSIAFAPDYASSGLFYVSYTRDHSPGVFGQTTVVEEFRRSAANPDVADLATRRRVIEAPNDGAESNHNAGQLQFGPDGLLYIGIGDGSDVPMAAQDKTSLLGKLLRIDPRGAAPLQYSIPAGNPFADGPGGNADEVYAYGLRNPFRFSFDRATGDLAIGDVGQDAFEEVDYKVEGAGAGANFGWPCFEGTLTPVPGTTCPQLPADHSPPSYQYAQPGGGAGSSSITGGYVIRDPALPSHAGRYVYADFTNAFPNMQTVQLTPTGSDATTGFGPNVTNPVSFGQDACGHLYLALYGGAVSRIDPASGPSPLCKLAPAVTLDAGASAAAATTGALGATVTCDEDCTATVRGTVRITSPVASAPATTKAKKKKKRKKRKKVKKASSVISTIEAAPVTTRIQLGDPTQVRLELSAADTAALNSALKSGGSGTAVLSVTATGGGGGSADSNVSVAVAGSVPQATDQPKPKKKKKKKRKKRKKRRGR
jgi:glucose/arabinose dehydrogenase